MDQFLGALEPIAMVEAQTTDLSSQATERNDEEAEQLDVEEEVQELQELDEVGGEEDAEHEYCLVYDDAMVEEHNFLKQLTIESLTSEMPYDAKAEVSKVEENVATDPIPEPAPQHLRGALSLVGEAPPLESDDVTNGENQELSLTKAHSDTNGVESLEFNCDDGKDYDERLTRGFLTKSQEAFFMEAFFDSMLKGVNNTAILSKSQNTSSDYEEKGGNDEANSVFKVESMPSIVYESQEESPLHSNVDSEHEQSVGPAAEDVDAALEDAVYDHEECDGDVASTSVEAEQVEDVAVDVGEKETKLAQAIEDEEKEIKKGDDYMALRQEPFKHAVTFVDATTKSASSAKFGATLKRRGTSGGPLALGSRKGSSILDLNSQIEAVIDEIVGAPKKEEKLALNGNNNRKATNVSNKRQIALSDEAKAIAIHKSVSKAIKPKDDPKTNKGDNVLEKIMKPKLEQSLVAQKAKVKQESKVSRVVKKVIQSQKQSDEDTKPNALHAPLDSISVASGVFDEKCKDDENVNDGTSDKGSRVSNGSKTASELSVRVQVRSHVATPRNASSRATSVCAMPPPPLSTSSVVYGPQICDTEKAEAPCGECIDAVSGCSCDFLDHESSVGGDSVVCAQEQLLPVEAPHVIKGYSCNEFVLCDGSERMDVASVGNGCYSRRSSAQEPATLFYGYYRPCSYTQGASRVNGLRRYFQADSKCQVGCRELGFDSLDAFNKSLNAPSEVIIKAPECFGGRQRVVFKDHVAKSLLLRRDWIANTVFQINWNMYRKRCAKRSRLSCCCV